MPTDISTVRFDRASSASRIAKSPVLVALLDQERLAKHLGDLSAATTAAAQARALAIKDTATLDTEIEQGIRNGADPAKLFAKVTEAHAARAHRDSAVQYLASFESRFKQRLEGWLSDQAFDLIDILSDRLADLLDRGEEIIAALGDARTADEAIDAGVATEWAKFRELHREYIAPREAHVALLRADSPDHFGTGSTAIAYAFFISPLRAWPQLADAHHGHIRRDGLDYEGVAPSPFDLTDPSGLDHFLAAVTRRAELGTHVADAEAADAAWRSAIQAAAPNRTAEGSTAGNELTNYYGSEAAVARYHFMRG
jgi:hypothetical protein